MGRPRKDANGDDTPDFGDRPQLPTETQGIDLETLSHNWHPGSPGVDMRDVSRPLTGSTVENLVSKLNAQENAEQEDKKAETVMLTREEYARRTKLDVSDPNYVNPSLDHHAVEGK